MEVVYNTTARPVEENTGSANTPRKKKNSWLLIPVILLLAFVVLTGALVRGDSLDDATRQAVDFIRLCAERTVEQNLPLREGVDFEPLLKHLIR